MSIADRPGLAPGMVGGFIAANGGFYGSEAGAGFIRGLLPVSWRVMLHLLLKGSRFLARCSPIMPIIVIPVLASLVVGLIFVFVIGAPGCGSV